MTGCPCGDRFGDRWHREHGVPVCDRARAARRAQDQEREDRDRIVRRRKALAQAALPPDRWARCQWRGGHSIYVPELDPC